MSRYSTQNGMLLSSNAQYFQYISLSALLIIDNVGFHGDFKVKNPLVSMVRGNCVSLTRSTTLGE